MKYFSQLLFLASAVSAAVPYEQYILAPSSRSVRPVSIYGSNGTVTSAVSLLSNKTSSPPNTIITPNSSVTFDFAKNIAGWPHLKVASDSGAIGVTFSESSLWISSEASDATADAGLDSPIIFNITKSGEYKPPSEQDRGGFRYMTISNYGSSDVELEDAWVHYTAMPHWPDDGLRNYTGWFHCNDEQLNRIWYAGAYTNQMVTIDSHRGDSLVYLGEITSNSTVNGTINWWSNTTITPGDSALTDGAKRDRLVWSGDMAIAVPGVAVSTSDLPSIRNSLDSLFALQNATTGQLPYAGHPFHEKLGLVSFTYHLYALIGVSDYYTWTGNTTYLKQHWPAFKTGMDWALSYVDSSNLANVTGIPNDWLRFGMGGHNIEANAILYHTLTLGATLATVLSEPNITSTYTALAASLRTAANSALWDADAGLYRDNTTTTLHPQDGNAWAIKSLLAPPSRAAAISTALQKRWTPYGPPAPEAADAISPFISGFELDAHFAANNTATALALMRSMWGDFMLDDPRMTNSTFLEGYSVTGELHYAPYKNDARISHAHGWATAPTAALTRDIAGMRVVAAGGQTWEAGPNPGDLLYAEAGFHTELGSFGSSWRKTSGGGLEWNVTTPAGTSGRIAVPVNGTGAVSVAWPNGTIEMKEYTADEGGRWWMHDVEGGDYRIVVGDGAGVGPQSSGAGRGMGLGRAGFVAAAVVALGMAVL
ncbi:bacterial alpha-L-rhamnosidase domain protein [Geopyxis carbonaria]|nr:bacterial alpha-L-rhamnosidase domain protein [Geopyxis carbonaria]